MTSAGDIVRLKEPYKPADFPQAKDPEWGGFAYGIVVEILETQMTVNGEPYGNAYLRRVSLNLYDASGQLMIEPSFVEAGLCIPSYVDRHLSELALYKIASASGYLPVSAPPDWEQLWSSEKAILGEFMIDEPLSWERPPVSYEALPPFDTSQYEPFNPGRRYVGYQNGYNEIIDILGAWPVPYVALPAIEHEDSWTAGMLHVILPENRPDLMPYYRWAGWAEAVSLPGFEDDDEEE